MKKGDWITANDLKLARRAHKDKLVAEKLLLRLLPRIRRALRIIVGNDRDADDLLGQTLVAVLESFGSYKGTGSLEAWAGRIAFHVAVRHKERRKMIETVMVSQSGESGVAVSNPEQEAAKRRVRDKVNAVLTKLPAERRYTLVLRLLFGHSVAEIADLTGVPVNTVRGRLRTGLKELRQSMASERDHILAQ